MARPRKPSVVLETEAEAREACRELLLATTAQEAVTAKRDEEAAAVTKRHEGVLARLAVEQRDLEAQLRDWYVRNAPEGRKSVDLLYGVIGTRSTPAALKLLNRAQTWAAVLVRLIDKFGERFVRRPEPEVNKDLVKAEIAEADLAGLGLKLEPSEEFYVDLNRAEK